MGVRVALVLPFAAATLANNCTTENVGNAFLDNTKKLDPMRCAKRVVRIPLPTFLLKHVNRSAHQVQPTVWITRAIHVQQEHIEM